MASSESKKFYVTFSAEEAAEIEQAAAQQQIPAAQVIRTRLREWQQATQSRPLDRSSAPALDEPKLQAAIHQLDSRLTVLHQTLQQFDPTGLGAQVGQQLRGSLQPLYQRLQQIEVSLADMGKRLLHLDAAKDAQPNQAVRFQRVEVFLEAIHLLTERLLLGLTPEQSRSAEQQFLDAVYARLISYLKHDGHLDC